MKGIFCPKEVHKSNISIDLGFCKESKVYYKVYKFSHSVGQLKFGVFKKEFYFPHSRLLVQSISFYSLVSSLNIVASHRLNCDNCLQKGPKVH